MDRTPPHNILPIRAERRRGTSPQDRVGGDIGYGAGEVSAEHPNAPIYVRGVMSRGRATASSIVPPRTNRGEGGRQHHGRWRPDAPVDQRDHPAPATVARQRRRERVAARDALLNRTKDVATIADLEAFAASVAAFFGEDASATGTAARTRDRSVRSREAGARRGVKGGERPEREGAGRPGSAPADPGASGERGLGQKNKNGLCTDLVRVHRKEVAHGSAENLLEARIRKQHSRAHALPLGGSHQRHGTVCTAFMPQTRRNHLANGLASHAELNTDIPPPLKELPFNKYKMNMFDQQNNIMLSMMKIIILRHKHEHQEIHKKRQIFNVITRP
ncbi:hypothetical protein G5I_04197 [Acromyrmex echinatior]|uniref:Uncharacterized protein n=1 Tax=Acromyrmex echinatior TaxID=103372 RepID=F4WEZ1_ACREC|nr:hypothetical protein G5I_04197 [Acromyrmex echinatior]